MSEFIDAPKPPAPPPRLRVPADYYSSPPGELRPLVPRAAVRGCGFAAAAFLLLAFIGGAIAMRIGFARPMAFMLDQSVAEMQKMFVKDVTPAQRTAFNNEMTQLSKNLAAGKTSVVRLPPVFAGIRDAIADEKVTVAETEKLTKLAHDAGVPAAPAKHK